MRTILTIITFVIALLCIPSFARGVDIRIESIQTAIKQLQPRISSDRLSKLSSYISVHSRESKIDPLLVTAIIFRESSFSYALQIGRETGREPLKCIGLMQIAPWGAAHKLGGYMDLTDADINIRTGVMWLEYSESICGDTMWQWVAAYGMSSCPSYHKARRDTATITARRLYCEIREDCEDIWPRWRR